MIRRAQCGAGVLAARAMALALAGAVAVAHAGEPSRAGPEGIPGAERRSGFEFMGAATRAMQLDDLANPAMLWVRDGEAQWRTAAGAASRACADCHGAEAASMRGVAARHPAFDPASQRPVDLAGRINLCRVRHQQAPEWPRESAPLLALTAFVGLQSRGMAVNPDADPRLAPHREAGRAIYHRRMGQLDLACAACHDQRWGRRLGGTVIPQAHPTGYPIYRLEWQALGSLQRRVRNCMTGVRAEPFEAGALEHVQIELYLQWRSAGLPVETPAVRP